MNKIEVNNLPWAVSQSEALEFTRKLGIEAGVYRIPASIIYITYRAWSNRPVSKVTFFRQFVRIHCPQKSNSVRYYLLNLSPEDFEEIKSGSTRARGECRG